MPPLSMGNLPEQPALDAEELEPQDLQVEVEEDEPASMGDITENADGSADIVIGEDKSLMESEDFMENLADLLEPTYLRKLGTEYKDLIDADVKAREKRDEQYADGIKRTGLGNDAPGGASFEGASKVVHPMLAKGCVDFASRAIKELFPASGPCKTQIIGEQTEAKLDKAERKKTYMNWQATTQIEENRSELEKLLSQVPLGGAQYKRWWWDPELKRPRTEAFFIDDVFMPYGHSDFYTSPRIAYRQRILPSEYERRVRTGLYRDLKLGDPGSSMNDESAAQAATDKVLGVDGNESLDEDGLRVVWQVEVNLACEDDPLCPLTDEEDEENCRAVPYILHLDDVSGEVLGMFRNWAERDDKFRKKHWTSEWSFIPWRDGPAVGLAHLIGTMSGAATGALRAILDAAHISNFPGAVKLKGGRTAGQSVQFDATMVTELDFPAGTDDIRKLIMPLPFNGPSTVLFQVMEWLTQQAEAVVSTAADKIADAGSDMPVGTALALIEHNSANFSAVHARLHNSMKRDLAILHRLDAEHLEDTETVEDLGELVVHRADFDGPMDIIPVSDPNIFSETQRYAQLQAVLQLLTMPQFAGFFKTEALLARFLKLLQIPDIEGITNLPKEAKKLTAVEENYAVAMSERPLKVYEEQDDLEHLKAHIHFGTSPIFGANPLIAPVSLPGLIQHCKEHLLAFYRKNVHAAIDAFKEIAENEGLDITEAQIQTSASAIMDKTMGELLGPMVMPGLEAMQKAVTEIAAASAPKASPEVQLAESTKMELGKLKVASEEKLEMERIKVKQREMDLESRLEEIGAKSSERMAALASSVELIRDQQNNGHAQMMAEFAASQERNMLMLTTVLSNLTAPSSEDTTATGPDGESITTSKKTTPPIFDPKLLAGPVMGTVLTMVEGQLGDALAKQQANFSAILEREQRNNEDALARLGEGLTALQQQTTQDRHVEMYVKPDGTKAARSFIPQQPPAQQPPTQQPQLPEGPQP